MSIKLNSIKPQKQNENYSFFVNGKKNLSQQNDIISNYRKNGALYSIYMKVIWFNFHYVYSHKMSIFTKQKIKL